MNKILKLALTLNEEDQKIAMVLLMKQPKLRKHFYNIALYLLTRVSSYDNNISSEFGKYRVNGRSASDTLNQAVCGVLGETLLQKKYKRYRVRVKRGRSYRQKMWEQTGTYYTAAKRSLKYLEENE